MTSNNYVYDVDLTPIPLFDGVPADVLTNITHDMTRVYVDGDIVFHQGDEADSLLVLLRGQVCISTDTTFIVARHPYDVIGEQAFIDRVPRSGTATAQGMVQALVLPRALVEGLFEHPIFVGNLLRIVSDKLREATNERAFHYRNEQLLFSEFRAHLSPEITQRLLASGLAYGNPRYIDAVILFSDIRSFTERSAGMTPDAIAEQLSHYFDVIVDVIHRHGGMVDKFIGDAVMAIWGFAPNPDVGDSVAQAFACAEEMVRTAKHMQFGDASIAIGVGLNTGQVFIGNVGGVGKRQFTVLGSPVNLAARFESEAKHLDAPIVMGQAFIDRLPAATQQLLVTHSEQAIKGVKAQSLYTFDPFNTENERG